eukprot:1877318-Pleurochrysis_carterae.AAC.1
MQDALGNADFDMCIALRVKANASQNSRYREHVTFLVEMQFDDSLENSFTKKRNELLHLKSLIDEYGMKQR